MLEKLSIKNVVITEVADGTTTTTTLKVDEIAFENNCTAEETVKVLKAFVDVFKTIRPVAKRRNTKPAKKRYHIYSLVNNHFVYDTQGDKYYTICAGSGMREVTKEQHDRMINRVKQNIREGYFDSSLKEYYSDTLPATE